MYGTSCDWYIDMGNDKIKVGLMSIAGDMAICHHCKTGMTKTCHINFMELALFQ